VPGVGNIGALNKAAFMRGNAKAVIIKDINSVGAGADENHMAIVTVGYRIVNAAVADMAGRADFSRGQIQRFGAKFNHQA